MKQVHYNGGTETTFDHVQQSVRGEELQRSRAIFVVYFDGEPNLWFSQKLDPSSADVDACLHELKEYYKADWGTTGRVMPILYSCGCSFDQIICK